MNIGKQIRHYRLQKSVRQEELADYLGVTAQAVSKWETDSSLPDVSLLPRIAIYFGITIDELFRFSDGDQLERIENAINIEQSIDDSAFAYYARFLERITEANAGGMRALIAKAQLYNHRAYADHLRADACARAALQTNPDEKAAWSALVEANGGRCGDEWLDNHFTLIECCKSILARHPANYRALYVVIENLLNDDRFDEALPYIERMGQLPGRNYQYEAYMGDIFLARGDRSGAVERWNAAVEKNPDVWQAYCARGDRMKKIGEYDAALRDYESCFVMQKGFALIDGLHSRAQLFEQLGRYAEAACERERIIAAVGGGAEQPENGFMRAQRAEIARLRAIGWVSAD